MTLQEQLRKLTTGGPGVTHIAAETLFEDCAKRLDALELALHKIAALGWSPQNGHILIAEAALAVPDPRCPTPGCKNFVESGEDYCTDCLDAQSETKCTGCYYPTPGEFVRRQDCPIHGPQSETGEKS